MSEPNDHAPGDAELLESLYRDHHALIRANLLGSVGAVAVAEDLLQECYLRAWEHIDALVAMPRSRRQAWLITVARRLAVDHFRRSASAARRFAELAGRVGMVGAGPPPPYQELLADETRRHVARVMEGLPPHLREVLRMSGVEGLNSRQIGDRLAMPAGTVRSRLHDARNRARSGLGPG